MYETINGWTVEDMKAAIRARNNGSVCVDGDNGCMYFHDGNRCAVGVFVPDHVTREDRTLSALGGTPLGFPDELMAGMPLDHAGLDAMQDEHDQFSGNGDMRDVLCEWVDEHVVNGPSALLPEPVAVPIPEELPAELVGVN